MTCSILSAASCWPLLSRSESLPGDEKEGREELYRHSVEGRKERDLVYERGGSK